MTDEYVDTRVRWEESEYEEDKQSRIGASYTILGP